MTDMLVRLYDLPEVGPLVKKLAEQGMVIRRAMAYEKSLVVDWVRDSFGDGWAGECDVAFSNRPVSCFIATEAGDIIGFACHDSICVNFFGPTVVAEKKRGLGIGTALFLSCLHAMAGHGYAYAIIGGVGPAAFYADTVGAMPIEGSSPGIYRDPRERRRRTRPLEATRDSAPRPDRSTLIGTTSMDGRSCSTYCGLRRKTTYRWAADGVNQADARKVRSTTQRV